MSKTIYYINIREYYGGSRVWHEGVMHTTDKKKLEKIITDWRKKASKVIDYGVLDFEILEIEENSHWEDENQIKKFLEEVL